MFGYKHMDRWQFEFESQPNVLFVRDRRLNPYNQLNIPILEPVTWSFTLSTCDIGLKNEKTTVTTSFSWGQTLRQNKSTYK